MMVDFPLLKTFNIESTVGSFLNKKFEKFRKIYPSSWKERGGNKYKDSGYQTPNILFWEEDEYQSFLKNNLCDIINDFLKCDWEYHWIHFLDYDVGGEMGAHVHKHNEDFVLFIYLKTCITGETVFYLNDQSPERTLVSITPTENVGAIFSSLIMHEGKYTKENKRIFVCGIKMR